MSTFEEREAAVAEFVRIEIAFLTLAWVAIALRVYVRTFMVKAFGWDDGWMVWAQLWHTVNVVGGFGGAATGGGRLMQDSTPIKIMFALRYWWICYFAFCMCMMGAKTSVAITLLRITPVTKKMHRLFINSCMYSTIVMLWVFAFLCIFQCKPIPYFWTRALGAQGSCLNMNVMVYLTYVMSTISALTDFILALLPVFLIKDLNMTRGAKLALIPILSMACIASTAVLVRLAYLETFRDPEFLYATVPIAIWSEVEMSLAITAGSVATLRPLYRVAAKHLSLKTNFFSSHRSYGVLPYSTKKTQNSEHHTTSNRRAGGGCGVGGGDIDGESTKNIVRVVDEEYIMETRHASKDMGITKVTKMEVEYEEQEEKAPRKHFVV